MFVIVPPTMLLHQPQLVARSLQGQHILGCFALVDYSLL